ncbi:hypothetical protein GCM10010911_25710 [Paenibacillus nasutitermitis]|uniref:Uncharacterized protein n=1 Tax=Paenibacillus nasutitermitis TaxID=1652958 RepID=A0A917DU35_9BACL|nr:hypothetical protein GCM10010911_25710 [Paenibacillus nasutitermitis]
MFTPPAGFDAGYGHTRFAIRMDHFTISDIDSDMMDRGVEEYEISDSQLTFRNIFSDLGLLFGSTRQFDAYFREYALRKG